MLMLIGIGVVAWFVSCLVVVCLCVMAARGDGRETSWAASAKTPVADRTPAARLTHHTF